MLNKNLLFVSFSLPKLIRLVLISNTLQPGILLVIPNVSLKTSATFQNTEATSERCYTKVALQ